MDNIAKITIELSSNRFFILFEGIAIALYDRLNRKCYIIKSELAKMNDATKICLYEMVKNYDSKVEIIEF